MFVIWTHVLALINKNIKQKKKKKKIYLYICDCVCVFMHQNPAKMFNYFSFEVISPSPIKAIKIFFGFHFCFYKWNWF